MSLVSKHLRSVTVKLDAYAKRNMDYVAEAADILEEIERMHHMIEIKGVAWCDQCEQRWPCATSRTIHQEN